jgi:broad specificity phosphatase PhoE
MRAVRAIARQHMGQRVLVVTHAGVINQVIGSITGASAAKWETPRPRNTSITHVLWGNSGASIVCFDDCSHLERSHNSLSSEAHVGSTDDPKPVTGGSVTVKLCPR